jgi:hypothetical protein
MSTRQKINLDPTTRAAFQKQGRIGGKKGGPKGGVARWANVSAKERTAHAKKAARARWSKAKKT